MNIYSVIPARGGSKGIPKKNIKLLNGRPLIDFTIQYSLNCSLISRTVVSTDSNEIASISKKSGADVPFLRPGEISLDETQDYPVFKHALIELEKFYNEEIDLIILLRPTSPFRPIGLIEEGVNKMIENPDATSLRSVTISKEHPYRQWLENGQFIKGYEENVFESYNIPRQLIPKVYFQTGDIEIIRRETLLNGSISGKKVIPLIISPEEMVDIDNMVDWIKAEKRLKKE